MDIEVVAIVVSDAPYGVFGIIYLLIWYGIVGIFLYSSINDFIKFSKKNCYVVMGRVSHIECRLAYHSKYDLNKYGSRMIIVDRVPDHESLVPMNKPAAGTIWYRPVYSYSFNGEDKTLTEINGKPYSEFKRNKFYKGAPVEIRISKIDNEAYAPAGKRNSSFIVLPIIFLILGIAQTVGFVFLLVNGIWSFV